MRPPMPEAERVAIRCSACDPAMRDASRGGTIVFYDDGLTKQCSHALGNDAPDCVGRSACGSSYNDCDWAPRIALRTRGARHHRQSGSARGQLQKLTAVTLHGALPESFCDASVPARAERRESLAQCLLMARAPGVVFTRRPQPPLAQERLRWPATNMRLGGATLAELRAPQHREEACRCQRRARPRRPRPDR